LTHILGGVAGGMEIIAQRMRIAHGAFDIHAWARVIPLLSNATIQAGIIGPDGWLVSTTLAPAPEPIDLWEFLSPRARGAVLAGVGAACCALARPRRICGL
jgi:hypothetical protein